MSNESLPSPKRKILIVDDSPVVLRLTRVMLEGFGYDVFTHGTPFGTAAVVLNERPDVVLMDVNMPALNGDELTRIIRSHPKTHHTRILLFSDLPEAELADRAHKASADGFVHKTLEPKELVRQLELFMRELVPVRSTGLNGNR